MAFPTFKQGMDTQAALAGGPGIQTPTPAAGTTHEIHADPMTLDQVT